MRSIIITGATGGLGSCIVRYLVQGGESRVICTYRNENKFNNVLCDVNKKVLGYEIQYGDTYNEICDLICENTDEIILVLNAFSINPLKSIGDYIPEDIKQMVDCNIMQPVCIINLLTKYSIDNNISLRVINIDSGAADFPLMGWGNYCASKSYINAMLRVLALENPEFKIVSVDPGVVDTDMQSQIRNTSKKVFDKVDEFQEYKRKGLLKNPKDVAEYIVNRYILNWSAVEFREKVR